ncbi:MAG: hypothetical protein AVDCRST_MAG64-2796, partial [uncultured Phycisphaerae bacterium]
SARAWSSPRPASSTKRSAARGT